MDVPKGPEQAADENAQTWWRAETAQSGQWLEIDLEKEMDVRAVQINFADDELSVECPGEIIGALQPRHIEERKMITRWKLEGSLDGKEYFMMEDKSDVTTDLPHDFSVWEEGIRARYIRLTILEIPYHAKPAVSGLRVFGKGEDRRPAEPDFTVSRSQNQLDLLVSVEGKKDAVGYNILWGHQEDKLYHSYQIYRKVDDVKEKRDAAIKKRIGALVKGQDYFVRVDAYNENGITRGNTVKL